MIKLAKQENSHLFKIAHWQVGAAQVYFIAAPEIPFLEMQLAFAAGSCFDQEQLGISQLVNVMLNQGTSHLSAKRLAQQLELVGAELETDADRDLGMLRLLSLSETRYLEKALHVASAIISTPNFPNAAFQNMKKRFIGAVHMRKQMPDAIAKDMLFGYLYGKHPYAHPVMGTPTTIAEIKRQDIIHFYDQHYVQQNAVLTLIGNLTQGRAKEISHALLAPLARGNNPPSMLSLPAHIPSTLHYEHQHFPSDQTVLMMGWLGIPNNSADYFPLLLANHILGGSSFNSILFKKIRVEQGLAYAISSTLTTMKLAGPIVIAVQTRHSHAQKTYTLTMNLLKEYYAYGPTKKALADAKREIIHGFPLSLMSTAAKSSYLLHIGAFGLPLNYLDSFRRNVANVSLHEVHRVIQQYLNPEKMCVVSVGQTPLHR